MVRKTLLFLFLVLVAGPVAADRVKDSIVAQLRAQGFTSIEVSRTLLGRSRIVAQSPTLNREIIYNPNTGVILRDYWSDRQSDAGSGVLIVDPTVNIPSRPAAPGAPGRGSDGSGTGDGSGDDSGGEDGDSGDGDSGDGDSGDGDGDGDGDD